MCCIRRKSSTEAASIVQKPPSSACVSTATTRIISISDQTHTHTAQQRAAEVRTVSQHTRGIDEKREERLVRPPGGRGRQVERSSSSTRGEHPDKNSQGALTTVCCWARLAAIEPVDGFPVVVVVSTRTTVFSCFRPPLLLRPAHQTQPMTIERV